MRHIIFPILNIDVSIDNMSLQNFMNSNKDDFTDFKKKLSSSKNVNKNILSLEIIEHFFKKTLYYCYNIFVLYLKHENAIEKRNT